MHRLRGIYANINYVSLFYLSLRCSSACGGQLNAPSGTISSPNYPNLYPHSRVCRWELVVATDRRVTLTINDLRLEDSGVSCPFDYVDVSPVLPTSATTVHFLTVTSSFILHIFISLIANIVE